MDNEITQPKEKDKYDVGFYCEHCGSLCKRYRRTLNASMALTLIYLYKARKTDWVHVEKWLIENGHPRSGDFHKLVHWNLLERLEEKRPDGSNRNGMYRLTGRSIMFIEGKLKVQKQAVILNGEFRGFEGEEVTIQDCLPKKFNYNELMGEMPTDSMMAVDFVSKLCSKPGKQGEIFS